jgi:oligosaccharide repeat unit polymerase
MGEDYLSVTVFGIAAVIAIRRYGLISPFSLSLLGFLAVCAVYALNTLDIDLVGLERSGFASLSERSTRMVLLTATLLLFCILVPIKEQQCSSKNAFLAPSWIYFGILFVCAGEAAAVAVKNGGIPPLLTGAGSEDSYGAFQIPLLSPLTYGIGRLGSVLIGVEILYTKGTLRDYLEQRRLPMGIVILSLLANASIGLRSLFVLPILNILFIIVLKFKVRRSATLVAVLVGIVFVVVGNIRAGELRLGDSQDFLSVVTGHKVVDDFLKWIVLYTAPNLANLSQVVDNYPYVGNGLVTLFQVIPQVGIGQPEWLPPTAIEYLSENSLLPYRGYTLRTALADYYPDFGVVGSGIAVAGLFLTFRFVQAKAMDSIRAAVFFATFGSSVAYLPLKDQFLGMPMIIPAIFALVICQNNGYWRPSQENNG